MSSYFCTLVSSLIPHYYRLKSLLRAGSPWFPPVSGGRGGGSVGLEKLWEDHSEGARAAKSKAGHSRERTDRLSSVCRPCQLGLWSEEQGTPGFQ